MSDPYTALQQKLKEIKILSDVGALLDWDQNVNLPKRAGGARAEQVEYIATELHRKLTDDDLIEQAMQCLDSGRLESGGSTLGSQTNDDRLLVVKEVMRTAQRQRKLPSAFVAERARVAAQTFQIWQHSKPAGDWGAVEPSLTRLFELYAQEGALLDGTTTNSPNIGAYNALLDVHERGATLEVLQPLFVRLGKHLSEIAQTLKERNAAPLALSLPAAAQERVSRSLATLIGYDFQRGALHEAEHPFMTSLGAHDFRITTHYHPDQPLSSVFSTLHEVGHALYEQGLPPEWSGTARGAPISLGVHESQSRFWENMIGRSHSFMTHLSRALAGEGIVVTKDALWRETNRVVPSLIRIEADEVTYSLHVVIRMLLEGELIAGTLKVKDLPDAWNAAYETYLGLTPSSPSEGVMQDVHWYCGLIGYFPTYTLGNLYSAMMREALEKQHGSLDEIVARGDFGVILGWLRKQVHQHGMKFGARELIERIAGEPFSEKPFLNYVCDKFQLPRLVLI